MRSFALPFALAVAALSACAAAPAGSAAGVNSNASDGGSIGKGDGGTATGPVLAPIADGAAAGDAAVAAETSPETTAAPDVAADAAVDAAVPDTADAADAVSEVATAEVAAADVAPADVGPADVGPPPNVKCAGAEFAFPTFSKACAGDGDCFAAYHQINCCGSLIALGLATSDKPAFEAAEKICGEQYPGCGCASQPTLAEDGYSAGVNPIAVKCAGGKCATYVVGAQMVCNSSGLQEPKPFKWCASAADCAWIPRTIDCCGSQMATGVTKASLATFSAAEAKCAAQAAVCDCLSKPMVAEDGKPVVGGEPAVVCKNGGCFAYSAP